MSDQFQAPAALSPGKSRNRKVGGFQGRSGGFGEEKNPSPLSGIEMSFLGIPVM
jgi:hypothetical protein